jgi:quercetin dioxygenase-like cupin family protein
VLGKACESHKGHEHNYDHTTIVIRGRIKVCYEYEKDGQTVSGESGEFGPGEDVFIRAKVRHTIKALEDNTVYMCIFSHRDFDGVVVETYVGNQSAYD